MFDNKKVLIGGLILIFVSLGYITFFTDSNDGLTGYVVVEKIKVS